MKEMQCERLHREVEHAPQEANIVYQQKHHEENVVLQYYRECRELLTNADEQMYRCTQTLHKEVMRSNYWLKVMNCRLLE